MSKKPKCIIVTGPPGAGKTTLAKALGARLWMPVISRDEIKEGYVNTFDIQHDQLPPETNSLASEFFFGIVSQYLRGDISIVIEAAFQHHVWEARINPILELSSPVMVLCSVEGHIAAQRHLQRGLKHPEREFFHGDQRVSHYKETGEILPPAEYSEPSLGIPTLHMRTVGEYSPTLDELLKQIRLVYA